MSLLRFIQKKIDPDRLIPTRGWLAVAALALQTGLLFAMAILLVGLDQRSADRTQTFHLKFTESTGLFNEFDNLYIHINLYEEAIARAIIYNDSTAFELMRSEQVLMNESLARLEKSVSEAGKPVVKQIHATIDTLYANSSLALNKWTQEGKNAALTQLAKTKSDNNVSNLCHQLLGVQMESLYNQVDEASKASSSPFKIILVLLSLLAGIVSLLLSYVMMRTLRRVMVDRRAYNKLLEEKAKAVEFTQNILNILPIGYHSTNKDGTITDMNQTELDWLGFTREEIIGVKNSFELWDAPDKFTKYVALKDTFVKEGHLTNIELTQVAKDGRLIPVMMNAKAVYDEQGNHIQSLSVVFNFTERKKLEKELLAANQDAESAQRFKKLFMANMSHEIRTPLNAILGFANFLGRANLPPDLKEFVHGIQISGANLLGIVNDILDFEKIKSGMLRIEQIEFDLPGLLHSVVTMVRPSAEEKGLQLILQTDSELPAFLIGDPMRLTQILINLLSNAIKFTETGSVILRIHTFPDAIPEGQIRVRFEVEDTGIGIAPTEHQRIFERFVQAGNDTSRKFGGTGLGLALVKMMVDLQHGTLQMRSELGHGSTFIVEIPYQSIRPEGISSDTTLTEPSFLADLSGYHVLVVEDNPMNRRIAELNLLQFGLHITHAENGLEAIECLKAQPTAFDLVFMDIQMPKMDGYAAANAIRHELKLTELPIVAMTAHVLMGEREKVLACGMNDYLTKPVNQQELAAILLKYVGCFWDNQAVRSFVGNNAENFREIVHLFIQQFPRDLAILRENLEQSNIKAVIEIAHNLRSTVGYAGFQKSLGAILLQLENEARKELPDKPLLLKLYTSVAENSKKAISILQDEMQKMDEKQSAKKGPWQLLLADDDQDDFLLFKVALEELDISTQLTSVQNGEQLMQWLHLKQGALPDILFLDLNMPRKNGFQCLGEIKQNDRLKHIPVVIYSTSYQKEVVTMLYNYGAHHYIQKPSDFALLKQAIQQAISSIQQNNLIQPSRDNFVLSFEP